MYNDKPKDMVPAADSKAFFNALYGGNKRNYSDYTDLMTSIGEVESFGGAKQSNAKSTAAGLYHILKDTRSTGIRRLYNILGRNKNLGPEFRSAVDALKGLKVSEMSEDQQKLLTMANLAEAPKAPFNAWLDGKADGFDLWSLGHKADKVYTDEIKAKDRENWTNAQSRIAKALALAAKTSGRGIETPKVGSLAVLSDKVSKDNPKDFYKDFYAGGNQESIPEGTSKFPREEKTINSNTQIKKPKPLDSAFQKFLNDSGNVEDYRPIDRDVPMRRKGGILYKR